MIVGIGHDIIENKRIERLYQNYGELLLNKILSNYEIKTFKENNKPINYIAKRFAAKEAFAKACGTGIRYPILFTSITVSNNNLGKPILLFSQTIKDWLTQHNIGHVHISLSDEKLFSSAFVILEYKL